MHHEAMPVPEDDAGNPTTLRLFEAAADSQALWAQKYARHHRRRRRLAWIIASLLAGPLAYGIPALTGGPRWETLVLAVFFTAGPLGCIAIAAQEAIKAAPSASYWRVAWAMMLLNAAGFLGRFHDTGHLAYGVIQALIAVCVPLVLSFALRIPPDPSVDWDAVQDDFLGNVRTGEIGKAYPCRIFDDQQAEEVCAGWIRRFGYADAMVSGKSKSGQDDGIDVWAAGAVAQVKYWLTKRVGVKEVRELAGAAALGQARFFFAASGYTKNAIRWAAHPSRGMALFTLRPDGHVIAMNYQAKKRLWFSPLRLPTRTTTPRSVWLIVLTAAVLGPGTAYYFGILAYLLVTSRASLEGIMVMAFLAALFLVMFLLTSAGPLRRVIRGAENYLRLRQWPGWRPVLVGPEPERPARASSLPPDSVIGYEGLAWLRIITMTIDLISTVRGWRSLVSSQVKRHL